MDDRKLPLVIEPNGNGKSKEELLAWMKANKQSFDKKFYENGAILFRGFDIDTPKDFEAIALQTDHV